MIFIGLDDTDIIGSPGTNRLARNIAEELPRFHLHPSVVLRHQLFLHPDVPYTSKNGSAGIVAEPFGALDLNALWTWLRAQILDFSPPGSDPALAILDRPAPPELKEYGALCQRALVTVDQAQSTAERLGVMLQSLAGRPHGLIGALAAVALSSEGQSGRVIHRAHWPWPDHRQGLFSLENLGSFGIDEVREEKSGQRLSSGSVLVEKRLRPSYRNHKVVLFVEGSPPQYRALKRH